MALNKVIDQLLNIQSTVDSLEFSQSLIKNLKILPTYPIILVAGTNGKGSTCEYLSSILTTAGYKVGKFTSPHVFKYEERICINAIPINAIKLENLLNFIIKFSQNKLGLFKTFTLASHLYFIENAIDIAIIEVGIGGKNDITNLFEPTISAITSIDFDHCEILGNTIEEIALQKSGIYRPCKWAFYADTKALETISTYCKTIDAKLQIINKDFGFQKNELSFTVWNENATHFNLPLPLLRGDEQLNNASLAISILDKLASNFPITLNAIKNGIINTKLIGRFQIMPGKPEIIFDVAHNPQAINKMLKNMLKLPYMSITNAVFGIALEKDLDSIIAQCKDKFEMWHIAKLSSERGMEPIKIKNCLLKYGVNANKIIVHTSISNAIANAIQTASNATRIICFGSFQVVEEAYTYRYLQKD